MSESKEKNDSCWGCITFILGILVLWALWFGLPVNGQTWHIDLFPPAVYSEAE